MAGVHVYGLLWVAAANDQIAYHLHLDLYTVTWVFRVLVLAGPALAFLLTRVISRALADRRRDEERRGRETGRIVMNPHGGYDEIRSQPAGRRRLAPIRPAGCPARAHARLTRQARKGDPGAMDGSSLIDAEYLYIPCARIRDHGHPAQTRRWVQPVPIVKKTAKLIYYTSDSWDRREAVVSPGCISREQFEADTRCHDRCPPRIPGRVIPVPGDRHRPGPAPRLFFATRQAAEASLYPGERQLEPSQPDTPHRKPRPSRNCADAMADAHPDRRRHGRAVHPSAPTGTRRRFGLRGGDAPTRGVRDQSASGGTPVTCVWARHTSVRASSW